MTGDQRAIIIERLREFSIPGAEDYPDWYPDICTEAADEIERLSGLNADMLAALKDALEAICWYDAENFENEHGIRIGEQLRVLIAKATGQTEARPPITDSDDGFDPVRAGAKT